MDIEVTHVMNLPGLAIYKLQVSKLEAGEAWRGGSMPSGMNTWEGKEEAGQIEVQLTLTSNHQSHTPCGHPSKIRHSTGVDSCVIEYQAIDLQL